MKNDRVITQQAFDSLLDWLDHDRERAGDKYENIRRRLTRIFICRGCCEADELADETINRVTAKLGEIADSYSGDPALYFYGVAQRVYLEYTRRKPPVQQSSVVGYEAVGRAPEHDYELEQEYACLEQCMELLPDDSRRLVLDYYKEEKRAKINHRKMLADELGIAVNALRIRAHRIRLQLQVCVESCRNQAPAQ